MAKHITVVDVGYENAGFGGLYTACMVKLRKAFGHQKVGRGYGCGFDMDQGMYVVAPVSQVKTALGHTADKVKVKRATGIEYNLGKCAVDLG